MSDKCPICNEKIPCEHMDTVTLEELFDKPLQFISCLVITDLEGNTTEHSETKIVRTKETLGEILEILASATKKLLKED